VTRGAVLIVVASSLVAFVATVFALACGMAKGCER